MSGDRPDPWAAPDADEHVRALRPYRSLADAAADPRAVIAMTADWGGTVLLTVPRARAACSPAVLRRLALDLDRLVWNNDDPGAVEVLVEPWPEDDLVGGGMGGGRVVDGVWLHAVIDPRVADRVRPVLDGERAWVDLDGIPAR